MRFISSILYTYKAITKSFTLPLKMVTTLDFILISYPFLINMETKLRFLHTSGTYNTSLNITTDPPNTIYTFLRLIHHYKYSFPYILFVLPLASLSFPRRVLSLFLCDVLLQSPPNTNLMKVPIPSLQKSS